MNKEIKTKLEFKDLYIVLMLDNKYVFPNNVVAYDNKNNLLWSINDIIKANDPCGNTVIKKVNEHIITVISSVGVMYKIDIYNKNIIDSMIIR